MEIDLDFRTQEVVITLPGGETVAIVFCRQYYRKKRRPRVGLGLTAPSGVVIVREELLGRGGKS